MDRLIQIIRNAFIRLEGLLYQFLGFFRKLLDWLNQRFNFLSRLLGFTESQYFLEKDEVGIKQRNAEPGKATEATQYSPPANSTTRRSPDPSMDYFLKLARQEKKENTSS